MNSSLRKSKIAVLASATLLLASAGVAIAEPRDGGEWDHGNSGGRVWSNYWHPKAAHGASVQGHTYVDSGCVAPGLWARAQAKSKWTPWATDGAYYRFCDM